MAARFLGRKGRGKKKTLSDYERERRRLWMREVQKLRWAKREKKQKVGKSIPINDF
jgi:hypothetical protein